MAVPNLNVKPFFFYFRRRPNKVLKEKNRKYSGIKGKYGKTERDLCIQVLYELNDNIQN